MASSNGFTCAPGLSGIPDVTSASTGNDTSLDEVSEESDKEGLLIFLKVPVYFSFIDLKKNIMKFN